MAYNIIVDATTLAKLGRVGDLSGWEGLNSLIASNRQVIITTTILKELEAAPPGAWGSKRAIDWILYHEEYTGLVKVEGIDNPILGDDYGEISMRDYISAHGGDNFIVLTDEKPTKAQQYFGGDSYGAIPFTIDLFLSGGISFQQAVSNITKLSAVPSGNAEAYLQEGAEFLGLAASLVIDGEVTYVRKDGLVQITLSLTENPGSLTIRSQSGEVAVIDLDDRFRVSEDGEITVNPDTLAEEHSLPLCFPAGTMIATPGGSTKIDSLLPGDLVLAFDSSADFGRGALVPRRVVRLFHNETEEWLRLTWREDSKDCELIVTPGHRFLDATGRFRRIDEIIADTTPTVVLADGSLAQVSAERIVWSEETRHLFEEVETVAMAAGDGLAHRMGGAWRSYNFEVEDLHTYVAGGARVHNDSQVTIDLAGSIGRTFGTQLANVLLEGESQFVKVLGGTVLGTITENLAEIITDVGYHFDGTQLSFGDAVKTAMRQLQDGPTGGSITEEMLGNFGGAVTSLFVAELGEKLGLEGFGGQLFATVGNAYLGSVSAQVAHNLYLGDAAFKGVNWSVPWQAIESSVGTFFGSALAQKLLPAETLEGSIGGSLGSLVGVSWAMGETAVGGLFGGLGALSNFLAPGIGSFIGALLGTFLGDLFGNTPDPGADFWMFAEKQGEVIVPGVFNYYLYAISRDGFPSQTTQALGQAVLDLSKKYMSNIGAFDMANAHIDNFTLPSAFIGNDPYNLGANPLIRVLQRMNVEVADDGSYEFYVNGRRVDSAEAMVDGAVTDFLRDSQPIGGDIFLKRAVVNSAGESSFTIASAMATAAEYARYLENREVINALIAGSEDTAFAGTWAYVLAGAELLNVAHTNQSDLNGGLGGFIASLIDAGIAADFSQVSVTRGAGGKILIDVAVDDTASIPSYIHLFANGATITPSGDGANIQFTFDADMAGVGYKNLTTSTLLGNSGRYSVDGASDGRDIWIAPDSNNYNFFDVGTHTIHVGDAEIESSDDILISGGGDDLLQAGTGWDWISGGAGNDTLYGGDQDDTIFGGAGDDLIYGGNQMDYLEGGEGADTICGISPNQHLPLETNATDYAIAGYKTSNAAVNINLEMGTATGGHATGDVLTYIIKLVGSDYNDTLVGNSTANWLEGGAGADVLDGGANPSNAPDYASYFYATAGVTASLADQSVNTGDAAGDVYIRIEALQGSNFDDILIGDDGDNYLSGYAGDDVLIAGAGKDSIRGGFGFDILSYRNLNAGITMDLANWASSSAVVADDVRYNYTQPGSMDIEAYEATDFADVMVGSTLDDILLARSANDTLTGGAGSDGLYGGDGDDLFVIATAGDHATGEVISGDAGTDELRFTAAAAATLVLTGGVSVEKVVIGTGTAAAAVLTGTTALNIDASAAANALTMTGNAGANILTGTAYADSLDGGAGSDMLIGGAGNDTLNGGAGVDIVSYASSTENLVVSLAIAGAQNVGSLGSDSLIGIEGLIGGLGNDSLTGDTGANALTGGAGNDVLSGGAGNDTLTGGDGFDMASYADATAGVTVSLALTTAQNTIGAGTDLLATIEGITGSGFNDNLTGDAVANLLSGGAGNDTLTGGAGNDTLFGGVGNDTLTGGADLDTASYADATAGVTVSLALTTAQNTVGAGTDLLTTIENLIGSAFNDTLTGDTGVNSLAGGDGDDALSGGAGDDTLSGGAGNDTLTGGDGFDIASYADATSGVTVSLALTTAQNTGGAGTDLLTTIESLTGSAFNDSLTGDAGANVLIGGAGNDTLIGGAGFDTASYADATAGVTVSLVLTTAQNTGGAGTDLLTTIENLTGSAFNDSLTGDAGANVLTGGAGNDTLSGGAGNDTLTGDAGIDTASYADATAGVTISLALTTAQNTGGAGTDLLTTIENLTGSAFNDSLTGDAAANLLLGGAGNDALSGGNGNDTLFGGAGNDTLTGDTGVDTASYADATAGVTVSLVLTTAQNTGGAGTDLLATIENLTGSAFSDSLTGDAGANVLTGGAGNDTLSGGAGNDTLTGGDGFDIASYADATAGITVSLALTTAQNTVGAGSDLLATIEGITGSGFNDNLTGDAVANLLTGGAGNDTLTGGAGSDGLYGGDGNDLFIIAAAGDHATGEVISGDAGTDELRFTAAVAGTLVLTGGVSVEKVVIGTGTAAAAVLTGTTALNVDASAAANGLTMTGNAGANILTGTAYADSLDGGAGNDTLIGGTGNDTLNGGAGVDIVSYASSTENLVVSLAIAGAQNVGSLGSDSLIGIEGLIGGSGNDSLTGDAGANVLTGGAGNDTLSGGAGNDTASYSDATSGVTVSLALTTAQNTGGAGTDLLATIENLTGSSFNDNLIGDVGANVLTGGAGNDTLSGGAGNDTLTGGDGFDIASYADATSGITVSLALTTAQNTIGAGTDLLATIEGITGSGFNDNLTGDAVANLLSGGTGNDTLTGGAGSDGLYGGDGDDLFVIATAGDHATGEVINGDAGTDELRFTAAAAATLVLTGGVSVEKVVIGTGTAAAAVLTGTTALNVDASAAANGLTMTGNAGANILTGTAYADSLDGGAGNDTLIGGAGNDSLNGGAGVDIVSYASSTENLVVSLEIAGAQNVGSLGSDSLIGIEGLIGGLGNDSLTGDAGANVLTGGAGNDTLSGGAGNDTLTGGDGFDIASYANATSGITVSLALTTAQNTVGAGTDILATIEGITGSGFNDNLTGDAVANLLSGGAGNDTLTGGAGSDALYGGGGDDLFVIATAGDHATGEVINGDAGTDELRFTAAAAATLVLTGGVSVEKVVIGTGTAAAAVLTGTTALNVDASAAANGLTMTGNAGANILTGTAYADSLDGGAGSDTLIGGTGNDTLNGGAGLNVLTGGDGADVFVFNATPNGTSNRATITDFSGADDDIWLAKSVMAGLGSTIGALSADMFWSGAGVTTSHDASDRVIYNETTGVLLYDADGSGSTAAIQIGQFTAGTVLSASDFFVI